MELKSTNRNNIIIIAAVLILVVGAGSFYGGMKYGQSKNVKSVAGNFSNRQFGAGGQRAGGGQGRGGGFINGEVIKKDNQSVTVKSADGGSKIIFLSDSVIVMKSTAGTKNDLQIGDQIMVNGTANSDGSLVAQTVQIRPLGQKPGQDFGQKAEQNTTTTPKNIQ